MVACLTTDEGNFGKFRRKKQGQINSSFLLRQRNANVLANLAHQICLDLRMPRNRRLACSIRVGVNGVISTFPLELAVMATQVFEQLVSLHAGTGG